MKCEYATSDGLWCAWAGEPCEPTASYCVKEAGESE